MEKIKTNKIKLFPTSFLAVNNESSNSQHSYHHNDKSKWWLHYQRSCPRITGVSWQQEKITNGDYNNDEGSQKKYRVLDKKIPNSFASALEFASPLHEAFDMNQSAPSILVAHLQVKLLRICKRVAVAWQGCKGNRIVASIMTTSCHVLLWAKTCWFGMILWLIKHQFGIDSLRRTQIGDEVKVTSFLEIKGHSMDILPILVILFFYRRLLQLDRNHGWVHAWIHCNLVTPYGDMDLGQYWLSQFLIALMPMTFS